MSPGAVFVALLLTICLMVFVVVTGPFRRILTYVWDLIWSFIIIMIFVMIVFGILSLIP